MRHRLGRCDDSLIQVVRIPKHCAVRLRLRKIDSTDGGETWTDISGLPGVD
jgi:hypothetical protein